MINSICIAGAGTMGSGIAQVAAQCGFKTLLFDVNRGVIEKAQTFIQKNLQILVSKQKISAEFSALAFQRIHFITDPNECRADIFIEAIIEKADAKIELFNQLGVINSPHTIFATNTSSLSVSAIQAGIIQPSRVAGMHFFNPAPAMKLVEVVKGSQTSEATIQLISGLCIKMGKTPVICKDAPGFIVNRVARHYYLEAMKLVELEIIGPEEVDTIMEASGFKMGPFKLMDLIGMDINLAVSESMYQAFNQAIRFEPSPIQVQKVAAGELGKKTGKGFYQYGL